MRVLDPLSGTHGMSRQEAGPMVAVSSSGEAIRVEVSWENKVSVETMEGWDQ